MPDFRDSFTAREVSEGILSLITMLRTRPGLHKHSHKHFEIFWLCCPRPQKIAFTQRFSRHPFVCAVLPFRTACFMNGNKKILDGHLPGIPQRRFLHHGFRQPLALCVRKEKKNVEKPLPSWVRAVSKIYNSIGEFTIPLEVFFLMRGVQ